VGVSQSFNENFDICEDASGATFNLYSSQSIGTVTSGNTKLIYKFRVNSTAYLAVCPEMDNLAYATSFNYITDNIAEEPPVPCSITTSYNRNNSYSGVTTEILNQLNSSLHAATFTDPVVITIGPS
jgi:hypothetical protein